MFFPLITIGPLNACLKLSMGLGLTNVFTLAQSGPFQIAVQRHPPSWMQMPWTRGLHSSTFGST